jgi:hypothetical protein
MKRLSLAEIGATKRRQAERIGAGVNCVTNAFHKHEKAPFELRVASLENGEAIAKLMRAQGVCRAFAAPVFDRADGARFILCAPPNACTPLAFESAARFALSAPDAVAVEESAALPDAVKAAARTLREYSQAPKSVTAENCADVEALRCSLFAACDVLHVRIADARRCEYSQVEALEA